VTPAQVRYHPDEWAHDLDEWWSPLTGLAAKADCASDDWLSVLGVGEFFEPRLLEQARVLTPWICLAASAVAASAARRWAEVAAQPDAEPAARALATAAFDVAVGLERLRWDGRRIGEGVLSTGELIDLGRRAVLALPAAPADVAASARPATSLAATLAAAEPIGLYLAAGWLAHAGAATTLGPTMIPEDCPHIEQQIRRDHDEAAVAAPVLADVPATGATAATGAVAATGAAFADIAAAAAGSDPIAWGTAHLIERLMDGMIDCGPAALRPDDPPAEARANVLLVAGHGQVGLFETRRQTSVLPVPPGIVVPDLARMAFVHGNGDFRSSVYTAYIAAAKAEQVKRAGELVSWHIQLPSGTHPLAEKQISGRSAGLGAYVAFRSLSNPGVFADKDVAFTGQVSPDGHVGEVENANDKIEAAHRRRIRVVVYPRGQAWVDPDDIVQLEGVERAEDALIAAAQQLRGLRSYLEAACRLVAPEPWLRTWLSRQGRSADKMPLLTVTCRHLPPARESLSDQAARKEPEVPPCPAHQLASLYPGYSFAVSADAGGGNTMAAKRMVASAARRALDGLRALGSDDRFPGFTLPLYVPLGTLPTTWDGVVQASVAALPALAEPGLEVAVALANTLRADNPRPWRALVVVDGTDRTHRSGSSAVADKERDFVALVTSSPHQSHPGWRPSRPAQVVLCGRHGSPAHHRAAEALRRERPDSTATMGLDPLTGAEIDRYVASLSTAGTSLTGKARDLATNPLLLTLSVIAGRSQHGEGDSTDLLDRVIDVLLGSEAGHRRYLAEIAFRAAVAKRQPVSEFTLADIAARGSESAVELALADNDTERAMAIALDRHERQAFQSAEEETHLLTASGAGWRFFHDRAFAFLVADRVARHAAEDPGSGDELFGELGSHLGDALWTDVIEATGRLLELPSRASSDRA
jgi:Lon protease (S16) C-terminal proteolytic domain